MLRTGMIKQSSTGIYSWLPLGCKVMKKIEALLSPELSARVEHQMLIIDAYRRAGVKYDKTKIAKNVQVILRALQDGAGKY